MAPISHPYKQGKRTRNRREWKCMADHSSMSLRISLEHIQQWKDHLLHSVNSRDTELIVSVRSVREEINRSVDDADNAVRRIMFRKGRSAQSLQTVIITLPDVSIAAFTIEGNTLMPARLMAITKGDSAVVPRTETEPRRGSFEGTSRPRIVRPPI
jgi:hypothetical protein